MLQSALCLTVGDEDTESLTHVSGQAAVAMVCQAAAGWDWDSKFFSGSASRRHTAPSAQRTGSEALTPNFALRTKHAGNAGTEA